ncbi:MAG: beta-N-acetylhexosaminidase [Clostridia bacterium]|jgi:beta-N-acetylhexosaminidase|nr:beta-N-acetylhexosaminidase [Clostridia bacterium]
MIKKILVLLAITLSLGAVSACSLVGDKEEKETKNQEKSIGDNSSKVKEPEAEPVDLIKEKIKTMTLEEKIGQMVIVGLDGYEISPNTVEFIDKYKVGGFIFFANNIQSSSQLLKFMNSIKAENSKNSIPLFLSIDEEGGRVTRMPKEFVKFPSNKIIGNVNKKEFSYEIGKVMANKIGAFGFNMNFAPVLDVNSNPSNPVIGDRAFSSEASIVSSLGVETMRGLQQGKVIPVVKHFPGHGDTAEDSHKGLPSLNHDLARLESLELIPFQEAINNDAEAVMIAHILLPQIDKENPSSMSKVIITDILREKMNFQGLVITDDMTMGAIMKNYEIGEASVKSVLAGTDIVLVCHGKDKQIQVIEALKKAALEGRISEERIDESLYRILSLKEKYAIKDEENPAVNVDEINADIRSVLNPYAK